MVQDIRYVAFISYAHRDEDAAQRLHRALETYAVPKGIDIGIGNDTEMRGKLSPIFRDVTELTAHHSLSEKIRAAVESSRCLIVLCSPAAKDSHWVNEEIRLFRKLHGEGAILSVIVDGTPDTAFPPALLEGGREPLAANISGGRESFRFGVTQLAASMLGVGLDRLVQRDAKRRRTRMGIITTAALLFSGVMGTMAWTAVSARNIAEISQVNAETSQLNAETSRAEAEKLVEYMIKDLKAALGPVGKLEILDGVGDRVVDYYAAIPLIDMDDDRLARQAKARHILGQVAIDQGKMDKAKTELEAAYTATKEVLRRNPTDTATIFAHAQSEYWLGEMYLRQSVYEKTLPYWKEYDRWGQYLYKTDSDNVDWIMEAGWGKANLGLVFNKLNKHDEALDEYRAVVDFFKNAKNNKPDSISINIEYANALAGLSNTYIAQNQYNLATKPRLAQVNVLTTLSTKHPDNFDVKYRLIQAQLQLIDISDQQSNSCNTINRITILDELQALFTYDQSNYTWKRDYVKYWHDFLVTCQVDIKKKDINSRIDGILDYAMKNLHTNALEKELSELTQLRVNSLD